MKVAVPAGARASTTTPESVVHGFAEALAVGDLPAAASCFTRDACLITPDATTVRGRDSIRPVLAQLILAGTKISVQLASVLTVADTALIRGHWTICSKGVNEALFEQATTPILVARRTEAEWKLQIAAPWG